MSIREQLFLQFAANGLNHALSDMLREYQPKKGKRFSVDDITYEVGMPEVSEKGISFEISSKIPEEKLSGKVDLKTYFNAVKKVIVKEKVKPVSVERENIIRTSNKKEKSRDYVKLMYLYSFKSIYDEKQIEKQMLSLLKDKNALKKVPSIAGVATIRGRLVLLSIEKSMFEKCTANIQSLISANKKVKKELKIRK